MIWIILLSGFSFGSGADLIDSRQIWKLESDQDGIALYSHANPPEKIVPLKGEMIVECSIEEVAAVLDDKTRRKEWVQSFEESHLLEKSTLYNQVEYVRIGLPLWLSDRTSVVKVTIEVSDDLNTVYIFGESTEHADADKFKKGVRAQVFNSSVKLERVPTGTKITTVLYTDPKGDIPGWLVNWFTERVARTSLMNLRAQLKKKLYSSDQLAKYTFRIQNYQKLKQQKVFPGTPYLN